MSLGGEGTPLSLKRVRRADRSPFPPTPLRQAESWYRGGEIPWSGGPKGLTRRNQIRLSKGPVSTFKDYRSPPEDRRSTGEDPETCNLYRPISP